MLSLAAVLLSFGALCLTSPVLHTMGTDCITGSLIQETLEEVQTLSSNSKGSSKIPPLKSLMEMEGNLTTYLEGFIEALKSHKNTSKTLIVHNLQKIQADEKSCLRLMPQNWKPVEEEGFFGNLEYFLRFLNHNNLLDKTE